MYKPNFCAECGARVERARWRWWTSRRFCAACSPRYRRGRVARPLAFVCVLLACGFAAGRLTRPAPPPLVLTPAPGANLSALAHTPPREAAKEAAPKKLEQTDATRYGPDGTDSERPTDPDEPVSLCGARTKKGTPCSRRVRGTGRCWQHRGRPAMLPPGKLLLKS